MKLTTMTAISTTVLKSSRNQAMQVKTTDGFDYLANVFWRDWVRVGGQAPSSGAYQGILAHRVEELSNIFSTSLLVLIESGYTKKAVVTF